MQIGADSNGTKTMQGGVRLDEVFAVQARPSRLSHRVDELKEHLLGLALTPCSGETRIPTIAHHHDFRWERPRFAVTCATDYLAAAFPPTLPSVQHVVINSFGGTQLALRAGASSALIPNVMDFDTPLHPRGTTTAVRCARSWVSRRTRTSCSSRRASCLASALSTPLS